MGCDCGTSSGPHSLVDSSSDQEQGRDSLPDDISIDSDEDSDELVAQLCGLASRSRDVATPMGDKGITSKDVSLGESDTVPAAPAPTRRRKADKIDFRTPFDQYAKGLGGSVVYDDEWLSWL